MKRVFLFGIGISITNLKRTVEYILKKEHSVGYICLPDMSVIANASKDDLLISILNDSLLTLPDGKPLEILAKRKGYKEVRTVSGYWLIKDLMQSDLSHYFYGANQQTIDTLINNLKKEFPASNIIGGSSPPMVALNEIKSNKEISTDMKMIKSLAPNILWIGISSPKQDYLMNFYHKTFDNTILIGVGGVFDYLAGQCKISPEWVKKIGMRWLYRLFQEPERLWKKYFNTFIFIFKNFLMSKRNK
jgi:exopolysaccharide biosynthesis WecB/TagA/CpsF family protein